MKTKSDESVTVVGDVVAAADNVVAVAAVAEDDAAGLRDRVHGGGDWVGSVVVALGAADVRLTVVIGWVGVSEMCDVVVGSHAVVGLIGTVAAAAAEVGDGMSIDTVAVNDAAVTPTERLLAVQIK